MKSNGRPDLKVCSTTSQVVFEIINYIRYSSRINFYPVHTFITNMTMNVQLLLDYSLISKTFKWLQYSQIFNYEKRWTGVKQSLFSFA